MNFRRTIKKPSVKNNDIEKSITPKLYNCYNYLAHKKVVVTGTIPSMTRVKIESILINIGAIPQRNITNSTDYLIAGNRPGSRKYKKAIGYGVPIIHFVDLEKDLKKWLI